VTVNMQEQKGVTRLSRAIDQADEEMEVALRRTEAVLRMTAERREHEIQELRRVIEAKEQGIDSLRDTLSCTKRALEGRIRQQEEVLAKQDTEVGHPAARQCTPILLSSSTIPAFSISIMDGMLELAVPQ
jgi:ElaB/YqjD/DUF883 family membrane-anchored ribosome-binding protein